MSSRRCPRAGPPPYASAAEALAAAGHRDLAPVLARARLEGDQTVLSWPGHDEFEKRIYRI